MNSCHSNREPFVVNLLVICVLTLVTTSLLVRVPIVESRGFDLTKLRIVEWIGEASL